MPLCLQLFRVFNHQGMVELDDNLPADDVCDAEVQYITCLNSVGRQPHIVNVIIYNIHRTT